MTVHTRKVQSKIQLHFNEAEKKSKYIKYINIYSFRDLKEETRRENHITCF